jgi:hypothetical protein
MTSGKSGKAIAKLLWQTIGPNYEKVIKNVKGDLITTATKERIGLNCAKKLFAVCGDNALLNDTFCNYLYKRILQDFDDNWTSNSDLP